MTYDNEYDYDNDADDYDVDDDSNDVRPCPICGAEIYEDSEQCPVCGNYITFGSVGPWSGRPLWWIILGVLGVAALIAVLFAWG
jgi:hypothetical protein